MFPTAPLPPTRTYRGPRNPLPTLALGTTNNRTGLDIQDFTSYTPTCSPTWPGLLLLTHWAGLFHQLGSCSPTWLGSRTWDGNTLLKHLAWNTLLTTTCGNTTVTWVPAHQLHLDSASQEHESSSTDNTFYVSALEHEVFGGTAITYLALDTHPPPRYTLYV